MADKLAAEQLEIYNELKAYRDSRFMVTWQYLGSYFLPQDSDINVQKTEGTTVGWTDRIFDTTGIECAESLKAGQYTWLTPPNQPWIEFGVPDELKPIDGQEQDDEATNWLAKASDKFMQALARGNFYSSVDMAFLGVGVFATDTLIFDEGKKSLFNFVHLKIGTYVVEEDDESIVDTLRREFEMTYRQAKQKFNKKGDTLPDKMEKEAQGAIGKSRKFKFLHCIFPREDSDRLPGAKDGPNKPFASVYIAMEYKEVVRVSGYEENPILCQRFARWGEDTPYGYGPAYLGLPNARQLNYVQQYMDALAELHADPRVLVPDNLEGDVDFRAGGVTTYESNNPAAKPEEWMSVGDYKLGMELQEQKREALRRMFFVDAFQLLNSEPLLDKEMTAYEISQRQAEQLSRFTPSFARRVPEFLTPLAYRGFAMMYRAGEFGQAPDSLMKDIGGGKRVLVTPKINVTSRIADALKALKNRGTEETIQFLTPLLEVMPEILDNFDTDILAKDYGRNTGLPPDAIRSDKDVAKLRAARAKLQAQQRNAALAEQLSTTGKNLGASPEWLQRQAATAIGAA